jgi:hypothetical protein
MIPPLILSVYSYNEIKKFSSDKNCHSIKMDTTAPHLVPENTLFTPRQGTGRIPIAILQTFYEILAT